MPRGWTGRSGLFRQNQVIVENNRVRSHGLSGKIRCRRLKSKFPEKVITFPEKHVIEKEAGLPRLGDVHGQIAPLSYAVSNRDIDRAAKGSDPIKIERIAKANHTIALVGLNRRLGGATRHFDIKRRELNERFLGNHDYRFGVSTGR